ncbi:hypothetical protein PP175_25965 (plasmid) [Aneurinibacillus sp. Ricciae_BoGa-3]|uniref:hypothetical protein n=1 Tax=Aneurinibacillus sp. Ricciae_BoGa-3 TaxID=3022697 RepID=UPI0023420B77|nr:hypothetical protein [Aneurinibacillus sp. Ricciae_BoGa-3]WCK57516.1 hypothetical protein PP175_25965 [Aneurinibacillus sp. Ricciae_BoGa-3]
MEKSVTITLSPMTFVVKGKTNEELVENAKQAMLEQLQKQFPSIAVSINDANVLTDEQATPGTIVATKEGIGIITALNEKTINVTLTAHRMVQGAPQAFKLSTATFEEARSKRADWMKPNWSEGDTAYLKNKGNIEEVVVGKKSGSKFKVYIINGGGVHYTLTEQQMNAILRDEKQQWK